MAKLVLLIVTEPMSTCCTGGAELLVHAAPRTARASTRARLAVRMRKPRLGCGERSEAVTINKRGRWRVVEVSALKSDRRNHMCPFQATIRQSVLHSRRGAGPAGHAGAPRMLSRGERTCRDHAWYSHLLRLRITRIAPRPCFTVSGGR